MGKQSQLLLQQTEVELGLQVGVEFDNSTNNNQNTIDTIEINLVLIMFFFFPPFVNIDYHHLQTFTGARNG